MFDACEVEFAGAEDGDFFHLRDDFGNPEIGDAGVVESFAEFARVDGDGGEEDEGLAFDFVGDGADGEFAVARGVDIEGAGNGAFDGFVRDHFAADFGEAGEAAFDEKETVVVHAGEVAGAKPAVGGEDFGAANGVVEVAGEDVGAFDPQHAGVVEGEGGVGLGIGDADGLTGEKFADAAGAVGGLDGVAGARRFGVVEVGADGGGGLGEAVALEDGQAEGGLEGGGEFGGELLSASDEEFDGAELLGFRLADVAAKESGGGDEEIDAVFFDEFDVFRGFQG